MFRYNLLYVTVSRPDTKGILYPTALNQLFTGVYVLELYLVGLFLLVRDDHQRSACVGQAVIMIIVTAITAVFQILLNEAFGPCLRFLPYIDMEDEMDTDCPGTALRDRHWTLQRLFKFFARTGASTCFEDVFSEKREDLKSSSNDMSSTGPLAFQHQSLRVEEPVVWIPDDPLGISNDEISHIRQRYSNIKISNRHASLNRMGRLTINQGSGNFSEIESIKL